MPNWYASLTEEVKKFMKENKESSSKVASGDRVSEKCWLMNEKIITK